MLQDRGALLDFAESLLHALNNAVASKGSPTALWTQPPVSAASEKAVEELVSAMQDDDPALKNKFFSTYQVGNVYDCA